MDERASVLSTSEQKAKRQAGDSQGPCADSHSEEETSEYDDASEEQLAREWMIEYRELSNEKRTLLLSADEKERLWELHRKLSNYYHQDPRRFDELFQAVSGCISMSDNAPTSRKRSCTPHDSPSRDDSSIPSEYPDSRQEIPCMDDNDARPYKSRRNSVLGPKSRTESSLEGHEKRFAEAYCQINSWPGCFRMLFGYGDPPSAKYEIGDPQRYTKEDLAGLPLISGKKESVLDIRVNGKYRYGFRNIGEVVHVATLTPRIDRGKKRRTTKTGKAVYPATLIKLNWINIEIKHQKDLNNCQDWNTRSKLMKRLKKGEKNQLDDWTRNAAKAQDESYKSWSKEKGFSDKERMPTFFPGKDWAG